MFHFQFHADLAVIVIRGRVLDSPCTVSIGAAGAVLFNLLLLLVHGTAMRLRILKQRCEDAPYAGFVGGKLPHEEALDAEHWLHDCSQLEMRFPRQYFLHGTHFQH